MERALASRSFTARSIARLLPFVTKLGRLACGSCVICSGQSHSCERATRKSAQSSAQTISVAEAISETTRTLPSPQDTPSVRHLFAFDDPILVEHRRREARVIGHHAQPLADLVAAAHVAVARAAHEAVLLGHAREVDARLKSGAG